jgi:hypothetical protein
MNTYSAEKRIIDIVDSENKVGDIFNIRKASCREMNMADLWDIITDNPTIPMSWGLHNRVCYGKIGMRFNVQGYKHRGFVYIVLNGSDLFDVYYTSNRDTIKKISKNLYYDQLLEVLDFEIEK